MAEPEILARVEVFAGIGYRLAGYPFFLRQLLQHDLYQPELLGVGQAGKRG
jgi:hypothetical protein